MLNNQWKHFKSGTDIRGSAVDGVPSEPLDLTDEAVSAMTAGFALWCEKKCGKSADRLCISVGRDSRITATAGATKT